MALTWSLATVSSGPNLILNRILWVPGPNVFVGVGKTATGSIPTSTNIVATSPDGVAWTLRTAAQGYAWQGLAFSPTLGSGSGRLVAVTNSTVTGGAVAITDQVMYSDNGGASWTSATSSERNAWNSVTWIAGSVNLFVAVAQSGTHRVMTSPDGITWTNQTAAAALTWNSIETDGTTLVAVAGTAASTSAVMTSPDGAIWTTRNTPSNANTLGNNYLTYAASLGMFVFCGRDTTTGIVSMWRSTNSGVTWTAWAGTPTGWATSANAQIAWCSGASLFVSGNSSSQYVITSADGITWTKTLMSDAGGDNFFRSWIACAYSPTLNLFVVHDFSDHDVFALGSGHTDSITPTTGHLGGGYTFTLTSAAGGFTANTQVYIDANLPANANGSVTIPGTFTPAADWIYPGMSLLVKAATNVVCVDANTITCTAPIGISHTATALSRACGVVAFDPSTGPGVPNISCWLATGFTYLNPVIASVAANSGTSVGGNTVTITGTNLYARGNGASGAALGNDIYFGDNRCDQSAVVVVNATTITCPVPANTSLTQPVDVSFRGIVYDPIAFALGSNPYVGDADTTSTLVAAYTYTAVTYTLDWSDVNGEGPFSDSTDVPFDFFLSSLVVPDDFVLSFSFIWQKRFFAVGTRIPWVVTSAPADTGWWLSVDENFTGAASAIYASRPKDPRSYKEIVSFATGSAAPHGGFPGPSCVLQNKLLYAAGGYTVGSASPTIRSYDGLFDREMVRVLRVGTAESRAVVTMLAANGTVYFSTLDSGTDSTDWSGRVFSLDLESGTVTQIGATFPAGHVPYALAWHAGRLWCGTHRQSSTAAGKVYFFRPGIDTAWTADYDLATASMANVTSLLSYKGRLFVGTTTAAATFAKVLVRSELGVYTTSTTATGGLATANNGFLALAEFSGSLYASFWNADTPKVSKIYVFDNTTWTTAYSGASSTLVPFVGFPQDTGVLLAIGGSVGYAGTLLSTANGTVWADRTAFLTQFSPTSTGLPVFGVIGH